MVLSPEGPFRIPGVVVKTVLLFVDGYGWGGTDPAVNPTLDYGGELLRLPPRPAGGEPVVLKDYSAKRGLWRDGALFGATAEQAFYVKCNEETNPPEVVNAGRVVTEIGVAPSKPAEFVVFRIQQFAGQQE